MTDYRLGAIAEAVDLSNRYLVRIHDFELSSEGGPLLSNVVQSVQLSASICISTIQDDS